MQKFVKKLTSITVIFAMLAITLAPSLTSAASITKAKATFGRLKVSNTADSVVVEFNSPTGIQAGTSDDIILTFSSEFVLAAEAAANFDIGLGNNACESSPTFSDEGVSLSAPDSSNWQVDVTGDIITLDPDTDSSLTAGRCIRIEMGTAATTGGTGAADTVTNSNDVDDDDTIAITGGFGDTGTITVDIIDDDQVTVTANVNQSITFDIDTATSDTNSSAPYSVALGTITTSDNRVSGATDGINSIFIDLGTNAAGGATVTVKNANGTNGLVSGSDNINSTTGTMATGTENYGLCVESVAQTTGTLSKAAPYDTGTCTTDNHTNVIDALTTTGESILTSTAPLGAGRAEILVNAGISSSTAAHSDYTDTLTFIATGTF